MEIIVNTNKKKTEIIGKKDSKLILNIKAKPENNQANKEVIKFFSKLYQKPIRIVKGLKSKNKVLKIG